MASFLLPDSASRSVRGLILTQDRGGARCDPRGKYNHIAHSQRTGTGQRIQQKAGLAPEESGCVFAHITWTDLSSRLLPFLICCQQVCVELTSRLAGDSQRGRGWRKPVFRSIQKLNLHFNRKENGRVSRCPGNQRITAAAAAGWQS